MYGKASFERSDVVSGCSSARLAGPRPRGRRSAEVTSATCTDAVVAAGAARIHERSCWPNAVPVTMRKRSSASRVTVKSHSMPPRGFSICVYVTAPTSRATRLSQSDSRKAAAPGPQTSIFANDDSSKIATASRQARCSAPIAGDQSLPAQPRGRSDSSPAAAFGSNQFARSQPDFSPNTAPSRASRS